MMRNSKKLAALFCAAALILSAAACSGGGDTASKASEGSNAGTAVSADPQNGESSAESTENTNADSSAESSAESSAPEPGSVLEWTFRETEKPTVTDAVYTTHPETGDEYTTETVTVKPMEFFDYEKAKEAIKKSPKFAGLEFVEIVDEVQDYHKSATDTIFVSPKKTVTFVGYDTDADSIRSDYIKRKTIDSFSDHAIVTLSTEQEYEEFDSPQNFTFSIRNIEITQDEVYEEAMAVFGEKLAEYFVYQQFESDHNDENENNMREEIKTSDEKVYYVFERSASIYSGKTIVSLGTECYSRVPDNTYSNGYKPVEWSIPLSSMLAADVGDTDYLKPETFFNKAFAANTKYDSYGSSVIERVYLTQAYFSDGGVTEKLLLTGYRTPVNCEYSSGWASLNSFKDRAIEIKTTISKAPDGAMTVGRFSMRYPLGYSSDKNALKSDIVDDLLVIGKQTAIDLLGLDSKALDGMETRTKDKTNDPAFIDLDHSQKAEEITFNIFGTEYTADIGIYAEGHLTYGGSDDQEAKYSGHIQIGDAF